MVLGAIAILVGIFAGEIASNLHSAWHTPVDSLGSWIISVIPHWGESLAISLFGDHDKGYLVAIILIAAVAAGAIAGKYWLAGKKQIAFYVVGIETVCGSATTLARPHSSVFAVIPWLVSGASALLAMKFFAQRKHDREIVDTNEEVSAALPEVSRRQALALGGSALGLGAFMLLTGQGVKTRTLNAIKRLAIPLPKATTPLPALPADPAAGIPGLSSLITDNANFYQIDTAINAPEIDPEQWRLSITGMVSNPITLTYQELLSRPLFELDDTMSCVSNPVGGPLIGNARWLGCRLDDLIREAKPLSGADQILSSSDDGFAAGFPLSALDGRGAMIAVGMNGQTLPVKHGYPARVIVPGLYGYVSATKWVTKIELTKFAQQQGFWISRGWSQLGPIKMESRIDTPQDGAGVKSEPTYIAGVAWAPDAGISGVQLQINGEPWMDAQLGPELSGTSWRQWWLPWSPTPGQKKITVRAIDKSGSIQPQTIADVAPNGASGWHQIVVDVN